MKIQPLQKLAWPAVLIWIAVIFTSIPLARSIQHTVERLAGRLAFEAVTGAAIACFLTASARRIIKQKNHAAIRLTLLAFILVFYCIWAYQLRSDPEEALHLVEYGVLAILIAGALSATVKDQLLWPSALATAGIIGTLDEIVQWLTPGRFFDFRDIELNFGAAGLALAGLAVSGAGFGVNRRWNKSSVVILASLCINQLLLISLCLSNTPSLTARLAHAFPALSYLPAKGNYMAEYGFQINAGHNTRFFSRCAPEVLLLRQDADAARTAETALRFSYPQDYAQILAANPPNLEPAVHEFFVHRFSRDQHLAAARTSRAAQDCTVAEREDLILRRYFTEALKRTGGKLAPADAAFLAGCADHQHQYYSRVSGNLIVSFNRFKVWAAFTAAVLLVLSLSKLALAGIIRKETGSGQQ